MSFCGLVMLPFTLDFLFKEWQMFRYCLCSRCCIRNNFKQHIIQFVNTTCNTRTKWKRVYSSLITISPLRKNQYKSDNNAQIILINPLRNKKKHAQTSKRHFGFYACCFIIYDVDRVQLTVYRTTYIPHNKGVIRMKSTNVL